MARWGLIIERMQGVGNSAAWEHRVVKHCDGTREQAMEALQALAMRYAASHKRARLYRSDDGFVLVVFGWLGDRDYRFSVAELVWSSELLAEPEPEPEPEPKPEPQDAGPPQGAFPLPRPPRPAPPPEPEPPWDADVPDRPSWLGRDDLP
jgi:hypothetical protein